MEKFKHLYIIPTNRSVVKTAVSYLEEINQAIEKNLLSEDDILFLVIEDGNEQNSIINETYINEISRNSRFTNIRHFSRSEKHNFINKICNGNDKLEVMFTKDISNYGMVANLTSLICASFGAEYIHRRDSDTLLYTYKNQIMSPLEIELDCFYNSEPRADIAGSNYFGNSDVNVDIFHDNNQLINELYIQLGNTSESSDEKLSLDLSPQFVNKEAECIPKEGMWPDMGNISYNNIYEQIPFPPHEETLGTDYFLTSIVSEIGGNIYLHNQRVIHEYKEMRNSENYLKKYYYNLAKYVDYNCLYSHQSISNFKNSSNSLLNKIELYLSDLVTSYDDMSINRIETLKYFSETFTKLDTSIGKKIGKHILNNTEKIMKEIESGVEDHLYLAGHWKTLMENAINMNSIDHHLELKN